MRSAVRNNKNRMYLPIVHIPVAVPAWWSTMPEGNQTYQEIRDECEREGPRVVGQILQNRILKGTVNWARQYSTGVSEDGVATARMKDLRVTNAECGWEPEAGIVDFQLPTGCGYLVNWFAAQSPGDILTANQQSILKLLAMKCPKPSWAIHSLLVALYATLNCTDCSNLVSPDGGWNGQDVPGGEIVTRAGNRHMVILDVTGRLAKYLDNLLSNNVNTGFPVYLRPEDYRLNTNLKDPQNYRTVDKGIVDVLTEVRVSTNPVVQAIIEDVARKKGYEPSQSAWVMANLCGGSLAACCMRKRLDAYFTSMDLARTVIMYRDHDVVSVRLGPVEVDPDRHHGELEVDEEEYKENERPNRDSKSYIYNLGQANDKSPGILEDARHALRMTNIYAKIDPFTLQQDSYRLRSRTEYSLAANECKSHKWSINERADPCHSVEVTTAMIEDLTKNGISVPPKAVEAGLGQKGLLARLEEPPSSTIHQNQFKYEELLNLPVWLENTLEGTSHRNSGRFNYAATERRRAEPYDKSDQFVLRTSDSVGAIELHQMPNIHSSKPVTWNFIVKEKDGKPRCYDIRVDKIPSTFRSLLEPIRQYAIDYLARECVIPLRERFNIVAKGNSDVEGMAMRWMGAIPYETVQPVIKDFGKLAMDIQGLLAPNVMPVHMPIKVNPMERFNVKPHPVTQLCTIAKSTIVQATTKLTTNIRQTIEYKQSNGENMAVQSEISPYHAAPVISSRPATWSQSYCGATCSNVGSSVVGKGRLA